MILSATNFFIPIIILLGLSTISSIILAVFRLKFLPVFTVEIIIGIIIASWFNKYMAELEMTAIVDGIYVTGLSLLMFLSGYEVEFAAFRDFELNEE
ncbi:MAG: hypothetical protein GX661_00445, partial [Acholeplasmataceae bacterium]|nr:hypothetical protein [Acholeplasmataceae bacterium]